MELNGDIRLEIARHKVTKYQIAVELGIAQPTFSHWLNDRELPEWKKTLVKEAIQNVARRKNGNSSNG